MKERKRAIFLGLPGSGTSFWAQLLMSMGWVAPPPYQGNRPYPTFETKALRDANASLLGGTVANQRRFDSDFAVNRPSDRDLADSERLVIHSSAHYERYFLKNPETTLTYVPLWSKWDWDHVIGVYRDPTANVESIWKHHLASPARARLTKADICRAWEHWNSIVFHHATIRVRFPASKADVNRFIAEIGDEPDGSVKFDESMVNSREGRAIPKWAAKLWRKLES